MNLFRRREQIHPEVASALAQLDRLAEETSTLRPATLLQGTILRAIYRDPPKVGVLDIAPEHAAEKLRGGVPLLRNETVPLDLPSIETLMLQLCQAAREHIQSSGEASELAAALRQRVLDVETLTSQVLLGQASAIRERAAGLGLDGDLLCTLLRFSLLPALEQLANQLAPFRAATRWEQGYCPTCGSWPLLGEYRGLEQTRLLRCGLCASEWSIDRLVCPFCGSRNHADLGYLYVEGDEHKRAVTCENCRSYVKMLATLTPIPPIELAIHDLATIHLDMVALEQGYAAPT